MIFSLLDYALGAGIALMAALVLFLVLFFNDLF